MGVRCGIRGKDSYLNYRGGGGAYVCEWRCDAFDGRSQFAVALSERLHSRIDVTDDIVPVLVEQQPVASAGVKKEAVDADYQTRYDNIKSKSR